MPNLIRTLPFLFALAGCASGPPPRAEAPACVFSAEDEAWVAGAVGAWGFTLAEIGGFAAPAGTQAIFFDDGCVRSSDALGSVGAPTWMASSHEGMVTLPGGEEMPAGVASFASAADGAAFFVMAAPSIWRATGVTSTPFSLETLMTAVMLHEASHVVQVQTYAARIGRLTEQFGLPEDFNDDSMQRRFEGDAAFAESIARETELLLAAATAPNDTEVRRLASEARLLMTARAARYFVGEDSYWREAEDVWLTMEGSGQWLAFQWLVHPAGGDVDANDALTNFGLRGRWWSQKQGFALFMALDRLTGGAWRADVFGSGNRTALQILDEALIVPT